MMRGGLAGDERLWSISGRTEPAGRGRSGLGYGPQWLADARRSAASRRPSDAAIRTGCGGVRTRPLMGHPTGRGTPRRAGGLVGIPVGRRPDRGLTAGRRCASVVGPGSPADRLQPDERPVCEDLWVGRGGGLAGSWTHRQRLPCAARIAERSGWRCLAAAGVADLNRRGPGRVAWVRRVSGALAELAAHLSLMPNRSSGPAAAGTGRWPRRGAGSPGSGDRPGAPRLGGVLVVRRSGRPVNVGRRRMIAPVSPGLRSAEGWWPRFVWARGWLVVAARLGSSRGVGAWGPSDGCAGLARGWARLGRWWLGG
jgi:hypothetical protein